jgi:hypothetical protein
VSNFLCFFNKLSVKYSHNDHDHDDDGIIVVESIYVHLTLFAYQFRLWILGRLGGDGPVH